MDYHCLLLCVRVIVESCKGRLKMKYTDDQIAEACIKSVNNMDMDTLLQFACDEMIYQFTVVASEESLDAFMQDLKR